ncbi:MAG: hypothetical protein ABIV94_10335, partial [Acidimicrobiales bacterium]
MRPTARRTGPVLAVLAVLAVVTSAPATLAAPAARAPAQAPAQPAPSCTPGGAPVELKGSVTPAEVNTYLELPVDVAPGTRRIEVGYSWYSVGSETGVDKT